MSFNFDVIPINKILESFDSDKLIQSLIAEAYVLNDTVNKASLELLNDIPYDISNPVNFPESTSGSYQMIYTDGKGILELPPISHSDEFLGTTAETFRSYNQGPDTITFGLPDGLGSRYGKYQWAANETLENGTLVLQDFGNKYGLWDQLKQATPGSPKFDDIWKNIYEIKPDFGAIQTEYLTSQVNNITNNISNFDFNNQTFGVKDAIYSCINSNIGQSNVFMQNAFRSIPDISSADPSTIINSLYNEKIQTKKYISDDLIRTQSITNPILLNNTKAAIREKFIILEQIGLELGTDYTKLEDITSASQLSNFMTVGIDEHVENRLVEISKGLWAPDELEQLNLTEYPEGFFDPKRVYPLQTRLEEPDFDRLARGETRNTPVEFKKAQKKTGIPTADGGSWDEPDPYYGAEYPHNHVIGTEGGITIEIDSTPGRERLHIYHPSNTFIEIDHQGNINLRNSKDKFDICDDNLRQEVGLDYHRTVEQNRTSKVQSNETEEIGGNATVTIGGNWTVNVGGDCNITVGGNCSLQVGGTLDIDSGGITTIN